MFLTVKKWLLERLAINLDKRLENWGLPEPAPLIIAQILHSYKLIKTTQLKLFQESECSLESFNYLSIILRNFGTNFNNKTLYDVVAGNKEALMEILHTIYIELTAVRPITSKYKVQKISEEPVESFEEKPADVDEAEEICPLLLNRWDHIKWHEDYLVEIIRKSQKLREEFRQLIERPSICDIKFEKEELPTDDEDEKFQKDSFEHLLKQEEQAKELQLTCEPNPKAARAILLQIKKRTKEKEMDKLRTQLNWKILNEMWKKIEDLEQPRCTEREEEKVLKLLKKSDIEHQKELEILEEKKKKQEESEKAKWLLKQKKKIQEENLLRALFVENMEMTRKFQQEYETKVNLHRQLYEEQKKLKHLQIEQFCADTVKDIVNLALKTAEYHKTYFEEPPAEVLKEWGRLFVLGLPILEPIISITTLEQKLKPEPEIKEEIQQALDRNEFEEYIDLIKGQEFFNNLKVFGHVIHLLLTAKHPILPPIPSKPKLEYELAVCVNSVDLEITDKLKYYLQNFAKIVHPDDVKEFCIKAYQEESREVEVGEDIVGILTGKEPEKGTGGKGKKGGKDKKGKEKKEKKSSDKSSKKGSKKGDKKGKGKKDATIGQPPKTELLDAQNQTPRLFPNERFLSEKAVLGKVAMDQTSDVLLVAMFVEYLKAHPEPAGWVFLNFPKTYEQSIILEQYLTGEEVPKVFKTAEDLERESKLLPLPQYVYKTPLTGYIKVCEQDYFDLDILFEELDKDQLSTFYTKQGCNYIFNYKEFNEESIKELGKLIVGNFSINPKESKDIFGELKKKVEAKEDGKEKGGKGGKKKGDKKKGDKKKDKSAKSSKKGGKADKKGKGKKGKKGKGEEPAKIPIEMKDEEIQMPEIIEPVIETLEPGEDGWIYCPLPINKNWASGLATMWEKVEENYTNNFKEIFANKRVIFNSVVPYFSQIRDEMFDWINIKDHSKQELINDFRLKYNDKVVAEPENQQKIVELIGEIREELLDICKNTFSSEEVRRQEIIKENWTYKTLVEFVNLALTALQLEIDLFIEGFRIVTAFYKSTLQNVTPEIDQAFTILSIDKINQDKEINLEGNIQNWVTKCLEFVEANTKVALENVKKVENITKSKTASTKKAAPLFVPETVDTDKAVKEWKAVLMGGKSRVIFYLNLIKVESLETIEHIKEISTRILSTIQERIENKNKQETEQVEKAIKIFNKAAEERKMVHQFIGLEQSLSETYIEIFPELPPILENFQMQQLDYFVDILLDLARNGILERDTLKYFIQELVEQFGRLPTTWAKLTITDLDKLFNAIYDQYEFIHWKDFVINNLNINFPREQMLQIRERFRRFDENCCEIVTKQQFQSLKIFNQEVANLLYKMYTTGEGVINYTAMLLDFCKDYNPVDGFTKALELALGRPICRDFDIGEDYVGKIMKRRNFYDKQIQELDERIKKIKEEVQKLLEFIVDKTVDECLCEVLIDEIDENEEEEEDLRTILPSLINVQVEAEAKIDGKLAYFLAWELVEVVIKAVIPWHSKIKGVTIPTFLEELKEIFESCRNPEFGRSVLAHEFLNCVDLQNFMRDIKRFLFVHPCRVVEAINAEKL